MADVHENLVDASTNATLDAMVCALNVEDLIQEGDLKKRIKMV